MQIPESILLGAHVSIAESLSKAIERGSQLGCTCIQLFVKNNRQWTAPALSSQTISEFRKAKENSSIQQVIAHATYLINLCSDTQESRVKSYEALRYELHASHELGIPYLVLHPGSSKGNRREAIEAIAHAINRLYSEQEISTMILLETMAGQGSTIGKTLEELAEIMHFIEPKEKVGICLDTCHLFAAGYDLRTRDTYEKTIQEIDSTIGLSKIHAIHINDSKKELGSRVDRHEHIGLGKIGIDAFSLLMNDERFKNIVKIIETPKDAHPLDDQRNLATLVSLIDTHRTIA